MKPPPLLGSALFPPALVKPALLAAMVFGLSGAAPAQGPTEDPTEQRASTEGRHRRARRRRPRVFVTSRGAPRLEVVAEIRTAVLPKSVEISPDGRRIWVCNFGRIESDNVYVYDAETFEKVGQVDFEGNAVETAFAPDGRTVYVSNFRRGMVEVIDAQTFEVRQEIRVGANPKFMVLSPDGSRLYVALYMGRQVAVIDTSTLEIIDRLHTGERPRGMAMRPDGQLLVASFRSDFIQRFSPEGEELSRFETCPFPRHLQLGADPDRVFVTCTLGQISLYDLQSEHRIGLARTGRNPRSLGVSPDGRWAATANFHSSDVTLADFENRTHRTSEVPGADQLVGLAVHVHEVDGEERLRVYATSWNNRTLYVLEPRRRRAAGE